MKDQVEICCSGYFEFLLVLNGLISLVLPTVIFVRGARISPWTVVRKGMILRNGRRVE